MNARATSSLVGLAFVLSTTMAQAVQVSSFATTFSASETLWQGTGIPATGFDTGNVRTPGPIGVQIRAQANSGTVASTVRGSISATYDEVLNSPGATSVKLNFNGGASQVSSNFGASATLSAFVSASGCIGFIDPIFGECVGIPASINETFDLTGVGAFLSPVRNFTANLGANSGSASDQEEVGSVGSLDLGIGRLGASADVDFRQTISLDENAIDGILRGVNRSNGAVVQQGFTIGGSDMTSVNLALLSNGIWDFSILDIDLFNLFRNTASLVLEPTVNYILGSTAIASLNVPLISNNFALDFNTLGRNNLFSILVTPVPAAFWLFGTALVGFIGFARRRNIT